MTIVQRDFFVAGGALERTAPCYVARVADREIYEGLLGDEFCYVLTPRQMGKSSLMVRAAARLQQAGVTVLVLDLTAIGQNLDLEKWYSGLLASVGQQLDLEDELDRFWWGNERMGPLQRWMTAIRQVVLPHCSSLVIFVDEIDVVRSLPFTTDEFFAAIRACFNHRGEDELLRRLTFCLLGVATPSDLISDTRMTPFNIGRRIELTDFTSDDAAVLSDGLEGSAAPADALLERILYWTGGHPYLTQRLCRAVAGRAASQDTGDPKADVDRVCESIFLSPAARQQDSNLIFVRERILRADGDLAGLLEEYRRVLRHSRVRNDERNPIHGTLRLSGITRTEDAYLRVRNRIYERVFDRDWIRASMPDAELRRQQAAFRRGLLRASAVASVFILVLAASASLAFFEWRIAEAQRVKADTAARTAQEALERAREARAQALLESERAEAARREEERHRQVAETQTAAALSAKLETEKALEAAEAARLEAETAKQGAEEAAQRAEEARGRAETAQLRAQSAEQQAIQDRRRAEEEKRVAEQRGRLFEKLLPLLREHAAEGVRLYAENLVRDGRPAEALGTFVDFCRLSIGEQQGFAAHDLLGLGQSDLQGLDPTAVELEISVPPRSLFEQVLAPGLDLGERQVAGRPEEQTKRLLAELHVYQARLLRQFVGEQWPIELPPDELALRSYDRAVTLQPDRYEYLLGRAAARFRAEDRSLDQILADVEGAIRLYPTPPAPPGGEAPTDRHREFAQLLHAWGNVLEYQAEANAHQAGEAHDLLIRAEQRHRRAREMDPQNSRYLLGVARVLRKRAESTAHGAPAAETLAQSEALLEQALGEAPGLAEAHNELGEIHLAAGNVLEARQAFVEAVRAADEAGDVRSLYVFYCNLANAHSREPTGPAEYQRALQAAERAVALPVASTVEGHYYRGQALWKLGRINQALDALNQALEADPHHVGAILARCQIVFEMREPNPAPAEAVRRARADVQRVVAEQNLRPEERAKAWYVNSLAGLHSHLTDGSERALLECLDSALKAAEGAPSYHASATQVFQYARGRTWRDPSLQAQSLALHSRWEQIRNE